jgi:hypothetical protein
MTGKLLVVLAVAASGAASLSACSRPQAVRDVATASQPVVLGIRRSGSEIQTRFQLQREAFAAREVDLQRLTASARARSDAIERKWRFSADEKKLAQLTKQLGVLREKDEQVRANPLAATAVPPPPEVETIKLDLAPLGRTLSALDLLKGTHRLDWEDYVAFGRATNEELDKLSREAGGEAAETPES